MAQLKKKAHGRPYTDPCWDDQRSIPFRELLHSVRDLKQTSKYLNMRFGGSEAVHELEDRGDSEDDKCRRLLLKALAYTIKDARGASVSGWECHYPETRLEIQAHAQEFFRVRSEELAGWGWFIRMLNFDERQAKLIEQYALEPQTKTIRTRIPNRPQCYTGSQTSWLQ